MSTVLIWLLGLVSYHEISNSFRIRQTSPGYIITRVLFITNQVANEPNGLNADTGLSDPRLTVCYVEVYGNFRVEGGPPDQLASHLPPNQFFTTGNWYSMASPGKSL